MTLRSVLSVCCLLALFDPAYRAGVEQWRRQHETSLKADNGWLTLAGLHWLKEGENEITLPGGAPARFSFHDGKTTFHAGATSREMRPDSSDIVAIGALTLRVIRRGLRYGVRVADNNSEARRQFRGLKWFPVDERYRVRARFVPYGRPRRIPVPNVLGDTLPMPTPGYVAFELGGRTLRLDPVLEDDHTLFFIFRDQTSGQETYAAGRFLYAAMPANGAVLLDFNKAENPPCAFTPYATCPLPPRRNHLPVPVPAGEKKYHE